jgi:hypothetical protein
MPRLPALVITDAERAELERRSRAHTTSQQALRRARIILLAADGVPNRQIAPRSASGPMRSPPGGADSPASGSRACLGVGLQVRSG